MADVKKGASGAKKSACGVHEKKVAERLGVSRDDLKKVRAEHLEYGAHFENVPGKGIFYSQAGIYAAVEALPGEMGVDTSDVEKNAPAAAEASFRFDCEGRVVRIWHRRRRLLTVKLLPGCKEQALVRVRDNRKFMIGQVLPLVAARRGGGGMFQLACRQPVRRGRLSWQRAQVIEDMKGGAE